MGNSQDTEIERVARAIFNAKAITINSWDSTDEETREDYRCFARAALFAMSRAPQKTGRVCALEQAALAAAYKLSEVFHDPDCNSIVWAHTPSVARIRELLDNPHIADGSEAAEAVRAWAELQERQA